MALAQIELLGGPMRQCNAFGTDSTKQGCYYYWSTLLLGAACHYNNPCVAVVSPWSQSLITSHCYGDASPLFLQASVNGDFCSCHCQRSVDRTVGPSYLYTLSWSYYTADLCWFCSVCWHLL